MTLRAEMHHDHHEWSMEHAAWNDDLHAWQMETEQARAQAARLESMLRDHNVTLLEHARKIRKHEQVVVSHEHTLSEQQRGALAMPMEPGSEVHQKERRNEWDLNEAHEILKKRHHAMMVAMAKFQELLDQPFPTK
jgi:hypothetical protein